PRRRGRERLNPHRRRPAPRGSVQPIVSEVPRRPFVEAKLYVRHFGYNPLRIPQTPPRRQPVRVIAVMTVIPGAPAQTTATGGRESSYDAPRLARKARA